MIYVQSRFNDEDGNHFQPDDEKRTMTQNSLHLLNENDGYTSIRSITPVYGDDDSKKKIANIYI